MGAVYHAPMNKIVDAIHEAISLARVNRENNNPDRTVIAPSVHEGVLYLFEEDVADEECVPFGCELEGHDPQKEPPFVVHLVTRAPEAIAYLNKHLALPPMPVKISVQEDVSYPGMQRVVAVFLEGTLTSALMPQDAVPSFVAKTFGLSV